MNSKVKCKVKWILVDLLFHLRPVFWNTGISPQATNLDIPRQRWWLIDILEVWIFLCGGDWFTQWFALLTTIDLSFSEKFVSFTLFIKIFDSSLFPVVMNHLLTTALIKCSRSSNLDWKFNKLHKCNTIYHKLNQNYSQDQKCVAKASENWITS